MQRWPVIEGQPVNPDHCIYMTDGSFALPPAGDATPDYQDRDANGLVWADMTNLVIPSTERATGFQLGRSVNPILGGPFQNAIPINRDMLLQEIENISVIKDRLSEYQDLIEALPQFKE